MRRVWMITAIAAAILGVLWLAEEGGLGERIAGLRGDNAGKGPSWGDVADKVGEFADVEGELKQAIGEGPPADAAPQALP